MRAHLHQTQKSTKFYVAQLIAPRLRPPIQLTNAIPSSAVCDPVKKRRQAAVPAPIAHFGPVLGPVHLNTLSLLNVAQQTKLQGTTHTPLAGSMK